jgi:hypothetical protein
MTARRLAPLLVGIAAGLAALGVGARRAGADDEAAAAAPGPVAPYKLDGAVTAGYRLVDIDGAKDKYKEDYNLRSGGRLFGLDVGGVSTAPADTHLDRFRLEIDTPHDEPVSRFRLTAADRERWDLRADFVRSHYFYDVPQLFAAPVAGNVRVDDLHDFDTRRVDGSVDFTLRTPDLPTLFFGYRRYERHGDATSTVNVPFGDTFVVDAPIDSVVHVGKLGTEFDALGTNVFLEQAYRSVDRHDDLGPVRTPAGVDPADASTLTAYRKAEDDHIDMPATTVRVRRPLGDRTELTGAYFYSHADLDFDVARARTGTLRGTGAPDVFAAVSRGQATLDTHVVDVGSATRLGERVRWHLDYRFDDRTQDGSTAETSTLGTLAAGTGYHVRSHRVTSDVELTPWDAVSLRAGVRFARRDAAFRKTLQDVTTDTLGAVASARWRPWSFLDLWARYENAQVDDPWTVPGDARGALAIPEREIVLTFTNRASTGLEVTPRGWLAVRYELTADSRENDTFAGRTRAFGNSVGLTLTPLPDLTFFASYTRRDVDGQADIRIAPTFGRFVSLQNGTENVLVTELRYDFTLHALPWTAGWDVAWVDSDQALRPNFEPGLLGRKFFDLARIDAGTYLTLRHRLLEPSVEFRWIDYDERVLPRNDYRAVLLAFKLTRRFSL